MNKKVLHFCTIITCLFAATLANIFSQNNYRSPNFNVTLKGIENLTEGDTIPSSRVASYIADFAIHLEDDPKQQAKALALAWACANARVQSKIAFADFCLRLGEFPEGSFFFIDAPSQEKLATVSNTLLKMAQELQDETDPSSKRLAAYLFDLLKNPQCPQTVSSQASASLLLSKSPSWAGVLTFADGNSSDDDSSTENEPNLNQLVMASTIKKGGKFAIRQSLVKGLLVKDLGSSEYAGMASQMNATVVDGESASKPTIIRFNQDVGESMMSALGEAQKFLSIRHEGFPPGKKIEIAFEEQYSSKDGPSAAIACTLLLDALITGEKYDSAFAVSGDMNADGAVQPVGGVDGKIRGAAKRKCTHVAIPKQTIGILQDMAVANDLKPLVAIQVFSINSFVDAKSLALNSDARDSNLKEAMDTFSKVQKVLLKSNGMSYLKNAHVQQRLAAVLELAPNHESARVLLQKGQGRIPKTLSLPGSFSQIDHVTKPMFAVLGSGNLNNASSKLSDSIYGLRRIRSKLDMRARPCADALEDLSNKLGSLSKSNLGNRDARYQSLLKSFQSSLERVRSEYNKLASDPEIQEELLQ